MHSVNAVTRLVLVFTLILLYSILRTVLCLSVLARAAEQEGIARRSSHTVCFGSSHSFVEQITVSGGLGSAALVDILVALTLTVYLKRRRSAGQWPKCVY